MSQEHAILLNEIRYAERLCQRTARYYRRIQAAGTFATVVGGSAALSALGHGVPAWVSIAGAAAFAVFGGALAAIRPADRAAANEADVKRYARLRTEGGAMDAAALRAALDKARETDTPELEPLRDIAFNDVVREVGRDDCVVPLTTAQRWLARFA